MTVLVTGATGFVGRAVVHGLAQAGIPVRAAVREATAPSRDINIETVATGDVNPATDWSPLVNGADAVIHLLARTHVIRESAPDPLALYRQINVENTRRLAEQAKAAGVRRFIFVSSIKVNGEATGDRPYRADDTPAPRDAYGISKAEAEEVLRQVAGSAMESVVVRPPLVYGPGVKGNFRRLMELVAKQVPLPLAGIRNRRCLVAVDNLASLLVQCVQVPSIGSRTFLVSDGAALSTPELVRLIAHAMGRRPRLLWAPASALRLLGMLTGRQEEMARLCGSLEVDDSETRRALSWRPAVSIEQAIRSTVSDYLGSAATIDAHVGMDARG